MHPAAQGSIIGGGVGLALALARKPKEGEADNRVARVLKSAAEGAAAGAIVGLVVDRRLRAQAAAIVATNAPVVLDALGEYVRRYEPTLEVAVDRLRDAALDAYGNARPRVVELAGSARGRAGGAYGVARPAIGDALGVVRSRLSA